MKAVILAGGFGSRLGEETALRPKPMVEIGGRPILWHIMKLFARCGINDFIVCLGYKGYVIKEYFFNYHLHRANVTVDIANNSIDVHDHEAEPWRVTLVDTGIDTATGGRLRRILPYLDDEPFYFTYGDGLADVDLHQLREFHFGRGRLATVTVVQPPGRFGAVTLRGDDVTSFVEKPTGDGGWINGGFFVLSPGIEKYLGDDSTVWEHEPLERLAADGELSAFRHYGFWQPMDTMRDRETLEAHLARGSTPWLD